MKLTSGLTLIELLIVIAIIGVLATVVLRSVNDARGGSADARVQSELDSISKQSLISFTSKNDFDAVCGSNGATQDLVIARLLASVGVISGEEPICNSTAQEFAVSAPLENGQFWCVDGDGVKKEIPNALTAVETTCP